MGARKSKFSPGDEVWLIQNDRHDTFSKEICPLCEGAKSFEAKTKSGLYLDCPKCNATGSITVREPGPERWLVREPCIVGEVQYGVERDSKEERYYTPCPGWYPGVMHTGPHFIGRAEDLFSSKEEAQVNCDRRNGMCDYERGMKKVATRTDHERIMELEARVMWLEKTLERIVREEKEDDLEVQQS